MKHPNIISAISGTAFFCTEEKAFELQKFVQMISEDHKLESFEGPGATDLSNVHITKDGVAVVPIHGMLVKRANMFTRISGGTSTEQLANVFRALASNDKVKAVVLDVDSPGGEAQGTFEAGVALRALREKKKVYGVVNENAHSGAYWIISAADRVFMLPTSSTGSIGVYTMHVDRSKENDEGSEKVTIVRAGKYKIVPNSVEPLTKTGIEILQNGVDKLYHEFVQAVAVNRGISFDAALKMADGRVYTGDDALKIGLADEMITSITEVIEMAKNELKESANVTDENNAVDNEAPAAVSEEDFESLVAVDLGDDLFAMVPESHAAAFEAAWKEHDDMVKEYGEIKAKYEAQVEELANVKAEALISEFESKITPASRERWVVRAAADLDETRSLLEDMADAVPLGQVIQSGDERAPEVPKGHAVATSDVQEQIYEDMGVKYVRQ